MTEAEIVGHVQRLEADASMGAPTRTSVMSELFDHALVRDEAWPDQFVVDLLCGRWGSRSRLAAAMAIEHGFKESGQVYSFVRFCIAHKRLRLVSAVADLGLPSDLAAEGACVGVSRATTDAGRWLDLMSNNQMRTSGWLDVLPDLEVQQTTLTSFPRQICAFANSPTGAALADILARHDPDHRDIPTMTPAGSAVLTEALMRRRIEATSAAASTGTPGTTSKATATRRRMGL